VKDVTLKFLIGLPFTKKPVHSCGYKKLLCQKGENILG